MEGIKGITPYGEGYHGFWTGDIMQINEHFGTADDLKQLSAEVHKRGMYIMIDVVVNNVAWAGPGDLVEYEKLAAPFNDKKYFHPFKYIKDYSDQLQVQNQWLGDKVVSLPDLNTELPYVQDVWHSWIQQMVANYSRTYIPYHTNECDFKNGFKSQDARTTPLTCVNSRRSANRCRQARKQGVLARISTSCECLYHGRSLPTCRRSTEFDVRLGC